jgi:hypothetical protein
MFLISLCPSFASNEISFLDSTFQTLYSQSGHYKIELIQNQFSVQNLSKGDLFIENNHHLLIRFPNVHLYLNGDYFYSFYPNEKKIIIDRYIETEFNIISILNRDWKNISIENVTSDGDSKTIHILMDDYDMRGKLEVSNQNFPQNLELVFNENESIQLNLDLIELKSIDFTILLLDTTDWEIIDFHE